jgi:hypothetical protein
MTDARLEPLWSVPFGARRCTIANLGGSEPAAAVLLRGSEVRILAPDGALADRWALPQSAVSLRTGDVDADGAAEMLSHHRAEIAAYRADGRRLWSFPAPAGVLSSAVLAGGVTAVAHNGPAGIHLLDATGRAIVHIEGV